MISAILADLLSDNFKRGTFLRDKSKFLENYAGLSSDERNALLEIDSRALERQVFLLIKKRAHEVAKLLPRTTQQLGGTFRSRFHLYAESFWPKGYQRHGIDALTFLRHIEKEDRKQIDEFEKALLEFRLAGRTSVLIKFKLLTNVFTPHGPKRGVALFLRSPFSKVSSHFFYI